MNKDFRGSGCAQASNHGFFRRLGYRDSRLVSKSDCSRNTGKSRIAARRGMEVHRSIIVGTLLCLDSLDEEVADTARLERARGL